MLSMNLIKSTLTDNSAVFDLRLQVGGESVTINLIAPTERDAIIKTSVIHQALEAATGCHFSWGDTTTIITEEI